MTKIQLLQNAITRLKQIDYQIDRRPIEKTLAGKYIHIRCTTPETEAFEMPVLKQNYSNASTAPQPAAALAYFKERLSNAF
ncbi:MAG: hypothetical protein IPH22_16330 [Nitrosomonas sp.]|nr:hypothetical protein [Nitrosomonas sp.]